MIEALGVQEGILTLIYVNFRKCIIRKKYACAATRLMSMPIASLANFRNGNPVFWTVLKSLNAFVKVKS